MLCQSQVQSNLQKCLTIPSLKLITGYAVPITSTVKSTKMSFGQRFHIETFTPSLILFWHGDILISLTRTCITAETNQISKVDQASISPFIHCFQITPFIFALVVSCVYLCRLLFERLPL